MGMFNNIICVLLTLFVCRVIMSLIVERLNSAMKLKDKLDTILHKQGEIKMTNKRFGICLTVIAVAAAVLYGLLCQGDLVWMDEAYTFGMIRRSYSEICAITAQDVHPPLYYLMLKAFAAPFGNKLLAGKIFSVIPYVVLIFFGGIQMKKLFKPKAGLAFGLLFMFSPFMLAYGAEVRMYSWAALFVFANAVYAYRAYRFDTYKDWTLFTLFGVLAAYTHYFALASVGIIYAMLFFAAIIKKRSLLKRWIIFSLITVLAYVFWLGFFIEQLKYKIDNEYWIEPITLKTVKTYFLDLFGVGGKMVSAVCVAAAYAVMLCGIAKEKKGDRLPILLGGAVPFLTLLAGLAASWIIRPVFVIRYLLPSIPLLIGAAAVGVSNIDSKTIKIAVAAASVAMGCYAYADAYYDRNTHFENRMDDEFYAQNSDCDAYIVTVDVPQPPGHTETVLAYYEKEKEIYQVVENYGYYPFENFRYIGDFDSDNYDRVILFLAQGKEVPREYKEVYDCEYRGTTTSLWIMTDVYLLKKR